MKIRQGAVLKQQIHILSGDRQRRWDDDQTRGLCSSDKFTYQLETGKDDGMG